LRVRMNTLGSVFVDGPTQGKEVGSPACASVFGKGESDWAIRRSIALESVSERKASK
jgi:hypothetical protein